ncbi:hypothetical protein CLAFUW4_10625 [Fulvia fulva]|uniref:Uncharacterized protein n=1 Tax=Passalora fulva TaxID=5499 RepID=A0A9Q8LGQ5_PASFU|nr:uncharacterized protein CLAFUR5_05238 [Fulvia fulva]KAK4615537.1 hypothetical protein CLAFUR4_10630 [Fulvia fulva]KAK4616836.1 hypothetical protein CLAFUR0_10614 [Fulvia fulva]UJO17096.1 hypothetical protein CLAFUR5_05238 [Fulvia fulva]WPV19420.1 hypothetical protein CLAFUW4_10625 [Fulvia fulva]WPV33996.1 hypothetical protein CLAFUW7_10627 [Fulvia fulva]
MEPNPMQAVIQTAEVLVASTCEHSRMLSAEQFNDMKNDPVLASHHLTKLGCPEGTSLDDVLTKTNPQYVQLPGPCGGPSCQNIDPMLWNARLCAAFEQAEETVRGILTADVELGYEYHNIGPAVRAKSANDKVCELTHEQFGIERRRVDDDPFFAPLRKIVNLLMRTGVLRNPSMIKPPVVKVLLHTLSSMRANVAVLSALDDDLATGVQYLQQVELNGDFKVQQNHFPSKVPGGQLKRANKSILPTMLFEQAVRWKWRARIYGLLQFLGQQPHILVCRNTR